jgi:capsular polysaccharide biosynthesis protein
MSQLLEQTIGKIIGVWALHLIDFHNINGLIDLREDGSVQSSVGIKHWAVSGPSLLLMDVRFKVIHIFQFAFYQGPAPVLVNVRTGTAKRWFLRSCGEPHRLTDLYEGMHKAEDIDFVNMLSSRKDFSVEIKPAVDISVPLEGDATIDHFADEHLTTNRDSPDYRISLNPQPVTLPPVFMSVVNDGKLVAGLVVEKADGRCLRESASLTDYGTSHDPFHCYIDYEKGVEYYLPVEPIDRIEGICIYIENGFGIDHWLMQSLPCIYILDWLEKAGVDFSKVKLLLRRGFSCDEHRDAFKAAGWLDKIPETSCIDMSKLSYIVKVDQLIFPSFMWMIVGANKPPHYHFSLYAISQAVKPVYDRIKQALLPTAPKKDHPPLVYLMRRTKTAAGKRLLNEEALFEALEPLGFTAVDPAELDLAGKIALYHNARVVVGARGGGLTLTLFSQPGTHVHMLCHKTTAFDFDHPKVIAAMTGAKFSCAIYPEILTAEDELYLFNQRCFSVDINEVVENMKKILARPELADLRRAAVSAA